MANLNKVMLMGNLTRDVELRAAGSSQVGNVSIAVNRKWTGQDGQAREEVTYVDCEAWGKTAEVMAKYLSKGRPVFIEGRLKLDQWDDKETGQKRSRMKVVIEGFQFIDSRGGGGGGGGAGQSNSSDDAGYVQTPAPSRAPARGGSRPAPSPAAEQINPDDIPF